MQTPYEKFVEQRKNARKRGIPWQLTFDEWKAIWDASGRWRQRGRGAKRYCMGRKGDVGAYHADNVIIISNAENLSTRTNTTRTPEHNARIAAGMRAYYGGRPLAVISEATRAKLQRSAKRRWREAKAKGNRTLSPV